MFLKDLRTGLRVVHRQPAGLAQELRFYRNYGFAIEDLPADKRVTLWQGLDDEIVAPVMTWQLTQVLPNCERISFPAVTSWRSRSPIR